MCENPQSNKCNPTVAPQQGEVSKLRIVKQNTFGNQQVVFPSIHFQLIKRPPLMGKESIILISFREEYMDLPDRKVRVDEVWFRGEYSKAVSTIGKAHY